MKSKYTLIIAILLFSALIFAGTSCKKTEVENFIVYSSENAVDFDLGSWDMDAENSVTIAHGLDCESIDFISAIIVNDEGVKIDLMSGGAGAISFDSVNIYVGRFIGSVFDSNTFDDTGINRGKISIEWR